MVDLSTWRREMAPAQWRRLLERPDDDRLAQTLRLATSRGRPLGSDRFVAKLETMLGRRLRPLSRGRPPKPPPTDGARRNAQQ